MLTLIVMTDGRREYLEQAAATFERLHGPITARVIHDDSGEPDYAAWLHEAFDGWTIVSTGARSGFAGAYRSAWSWLRDNCRTDWVFSTEDDFTFERDVDLTAMASVMLLRPMAQMALLRQPWNRAEQAAGGIVEQHPDDYLDRSDGTHHWLQHRRFFTTNPNLTRLRFIKAHDWPEGSESEGRFGVDLFASEPMTTCGFWGPRGAGPWVRHIGAHRAGTVY